MSAPTPTFSIGGIDVSRVGFGAMRLCGQPGNFGPFPDWEAGKRLLRRAVELGVNFIDTAHAYGPGANEELIADALAPYPENLVIATKGGVEKTAPDKVFPDGRPEILRQRCEDSLRRLRVERIHLYQLHRPDPNVPFVESLGALVELRAAGKIAHIGLSNVTLAQIEEALAITPIASVQNRYNLYERGDDPIVKFCNERGVAFLPTGPLAAKPFTAEAPLTADRALYAMGSRCNANQAQTALAWLLQLSPNIVVIPGTTSIEHLEQNVAAAKIEIHINDRLALNLADFSKR